MFISKTPQKVWKKEEKKKEKWSKSAFMVKIVKMDIFKYIIEYWRNKVWMWKDNSSNVVLVVDLCPLKTKLSDVLKVLRKRDAASVCEA